MTCRVCGCTDGDCRQCIEKTGEPCSWVSQNLCTACAVDRPPLDLATARIEDAIFELSEGNPGAINAMMIVYTGVSRKAVPFLIGLDDMNIRGSQIWVAFKDAASGDPQKLAELVIARDKSLVATVNRECPHKPQAVAGGHRPKTAVDAFFNFTGAVMP